MRLFSLEKEFADGLQTEINDKKILAKQILHNKIALAFLFWHIFDGEMSPGWTIRILRHHI